MKRTLQILNALSVVFALVMNIIVGARLINVPSIGEVSDRYATLLTPATYAFSIWALIYLLLIVFAVYQARDLFKPKENNTLPHRLGPYFILANIGNGLWTYIFVSDFIGTSVLVLLGMVATLFLAMRRLNIAMYSAPLRTVICVWWPLMIYTGWVLVASVVNIASWLASLGITIDQFAIFIILTVLCNLLLVLLYLRNVRELVLASTWGIAAIGVRAVQMNEGTLVITTIFTVSAVLLIASAVHAFINRRSNMLVYVL